MQANPGQKVDRRVAKTRRAIHEALCRLIAEEGVGKVTVSAIAREADIDRKTFYSHFSSIDDLIEQEAEGIVGRIVETVFKADGPSERRAGIRLKPMLVELASIVEQDPEMYCSLMRSLSVDQMVDALYGPVLQAASKDPVLAAADSDVLGFIVRFYLSGALAVFVQWLEAGGKTPIAVLADLVERTFDPNPALSAQV